MEFSLLSFTPAHGKTSRGFNQEFCLGFWMIFDLKAYEALVLDRIRYSLPYHPEVCQGKDNLQFWVVLADASIEDFPESKLTFDDPKKMLHFGAEVGLDRHWRDSYRLVQRTRESPP